MPVKRPKTRQQQRGVWGSNVRLDSLSYAVVMVTAVLLGLIWWQTMTRIGGESQLAIDAAQKDSQNMTYLVAGHFSHTMNRIDRLGTLAESLLDGRPNAVLQLDAALGNDPALLGMIVLDPSAGMRYNSARRFVDQAQLNWAALQINRGDDFKRAAVMAPQADDWRMGLLLPIRQPGRSDGPLVGGLLLTIDLGYFFQLVQAVDLGERGELSVFSEAGFEVLRARKAGMMAPRERVPPGMMLSSGLRDIAPFSAPDDQAERRLYTMAAVGKGVLHVAVSRAHNEILEGNTAARRRYLFWALVATLFTGVATFALVTLMQRQNRTWDVLARTEQENQRLIRQLDTEKTKAYQLAYYDQLTSLPNRNFFRAMATDRLIGSRRRRKGSAIIFIDLDRFKAVNDTHGHAVGDELLIEVARRLREALRESDLISRFGGDEFVTQVIDLESVSHLDVLAEKIIEAIGQAYRLGSVDVDIEILPSVGIAVCPQDGETIEQLLKNADAAMYEAKRSGRGAYRFFDAQLNAKVQLYANLEQRLRHAIANHEFVMHYQPRISASGYRIVSLEALVRWNHPEFGMVYPGDFIPLAEESGHIVELGTAILNQVCRQIAKWRAAGLNTPPVAVNASAKQLRDEGFVDLVRHAVESAGISFHDLEIEVTESCVMEDPELSAAILESLVKLGVRISLDDYGTGYSSLSSIKRLPLYAIKIDRSFVADIGIDSNDDVIVASTISMSHGLGLRVVAEGVETRDQLKRLRILGCEEVQGYLFSRPLPVDEIGKLLKRGVCWPQGVESEERGVAA